MHLLDTDTLTHLHAGHPQVALRLRNCADPDIATTVISKIEMLRGRMDFLLKAENQERLLRAQQLLNQTENLLEQIPVVGFDAKAAGIFESLRNISALRKIGRADLLIAGIALANRATLVTRNLKHFNQFPNLRVVNRVD